MVKTTLRKTIRALPIEDRIDLFEELAQSIATDEANIPLQQWQEQLLNDRIAQYEANPKAVMTLAQFKTKAKALFRELNRSFHPKQNQ